MTLSYDEYRTTPLIAKLRAANEGIVAEAMQDIASSPDLASPACKLEFFNRMLDLLLGEHDE